MYGPYTVDDLIFRMLNIKSDIVASTLEGKEKEFNIPHVQKRVKFDDENPEEDGDEENKESTDL
jgi:hypothetical protein